MPKVSHVHLLEERSMPWSGELLIPPRERELRRSEGSGKLIGDPLVEGSRASSTDGELWRVENSFLRMRRHSAAQKGAASPTMSSGERGAHSSE